MKKIIILIMIISLSSCTLFEKKELTIEQKTKIEEVKKENNNKLFNSYAELRKNKEFLDLESQFNKQQGEWDEEGMESTRKKMEAFYSEDMLKLQKELKLK